ncbi:MAG: PspC domain-containing protein [Bacteroidota bacterium]|nr:PspC domain-containing protein [Bacteroidota bacterium]MEC8367534.1 PspC domain-containing protein [Bacteroidota bacterium]MEC8602015.1 PspC domain-containing protein [Bacteroidota bacterium]
MKKTLTANISGKVFNIEEDAYGIMSKYLESVSLYFKNYNDKDEILVDFEQRISENLLSILSNSNEVVTNSHVSKIIEIMGKPQDFDIDSSEDFDQATKYKLKRNNNDRIIAGVASGLAEYFKIDPLITRILLASLMFVGGFGFFFYIVCWIAMPKSFMNESFNRKKFYRDSDEKIIVGVCKGIANYLSINVIYVRILFLAMIFIGGWGLILYLILWIFSRSAKTVKQKMDMSGYKMDLDNLKKYYDDSLKKSKVQKNKSSILFFPFKLIGQFFDKLLPFLGQVPKVILIIILFYLVSLAAIILVFFTVIYFGLYVSNDELLNMIQLLLVDLKPISVTMIYVELIAFITLLSFGIIKLLTERSINKTLVISTAILLFLVTIFNGITLGINEKLDNNIEEIVEYIDDRYDFLSITIEID